jgi:hypothetical protein
MGLELQDQEVAATQDSEGVFMPSTGPNFDELEKLIEEDERKDGLEVARIMKPRDYARARSIYPQKVYRALREGKLDWERCECGTYCILIKQADDLFGFTKDEEEEDE